MTREELEAALRSIEKKALKYPGPWLTTWYAARMQLALMAETCGECQGSGEVENVVYAGHGPMVVCPTCHGSGKVYPQETVKAVKRSLLSVAGEIASDGSFWCPNIDQAVVAVLDALGETE